MGDGITVDQGRVLALLRQRHAQQLDELVLEAVQWQVAAEQFQAENEELRAELRRVTDDGDVPES